LIFLMALFAIYQGALYNEFFSLPMNFGSQYVLQYGPRFNNNTFQLRERDPTKIYAFGVDPVWKGSTNELLYYNSVKMKMSIIVGVIQMSLGIFLHLLNALYFHEMYDIFFEFLPRILFLWCIFGYLCFMIFFKWCTDYVGQDIYNDGLNRTLSNNTMKGTQGAPVLLNELIFMVLPAPEGQTNNLYSFQEDLQKALIVIAILCIPIMMFCKPCLLLYKHKQKTKTTIVHHVDEEDSESEPILTDDHGGHGHGHGHFQFSEIMVHQALETIEFVLGSVSHTASYLRLWALSLAHSELATVFWDKIMYMLISLPATSEMGSGVTVAILTAILAFVGYSVWFGATILVMMFMEGLSAFLHALRLHWVEFQSKFYKGDGHPFQPFSYAKISDPSDNEFN